VLKGQQVTETVAASRVDDSELERERWRHEERLKKLELELIRAQMERRFGSVCRLTVEIVP